MIKLVALDMDGTLLNNDKKISVNNKEAIYRCKEKGVKFVLATGRPLIGINKFLKELDLFSETDYSIVLNGASVQKNKTGKPYFQEEISMNNFLKIKKFLNKNKIDFHIYTEDFVFSEGGNLYTEYEAKENGIELIKGNFNTIKNKKILKIVIGEDKYILDQIEKIIPLEFRNEFTVIRSAPYFLEFLNKKGDKGAGVKYLANLFSFKKEEILCMGDAGNDISMLLYAGLPITLSNAFQEVKDISKYITKSNEEDGVAEALNKFILK